MNDQDLIRQIRSGHVEVYGELVRQYNRKVMGSCLSMLENNRDAEEAAQDIFVKAYQSLDKFKGDSSFSTWLYRITANHCLDILRWRTRQKTVSLNALIEKNENQIHWIFATPETAASTFENRQLIHRILSTLPDECRIILTLRELEELEFQEIADVLDCSLVTVKVRLARARRLLNENLKFVLSGPKRYSRKVELNPLKR